MTDIKRYVQKNQSLFSLVNKIKLWPARSGILHGLRSVSLHGRLIELETHCGEKFTVWNSRTSRSARWLRNHQCMGACHKCGVPAWKMEKYSGTAFTDRGGR